MDSCHRNWRLLVTANRADFGLQADWYLFRCPVSSPLFVFEATQNKIPMDSAPSYADKTTDLPDSGVCLVSTKSL